MQRESSIHTEPLGNYWNERFKMRRITMQNNGIIRIT